MNDDIYENIKSALAQEAATSLISDDMIVGLGSGSTARLFIDALGRRVQNEALRIQAVASSQASYDLAKQWGIPLLSERVFSYTDITVDGADEVDGNLVLIKGGGGALFREKILIQAAKRSVILVDERKCVDVLGTFPLPVEISVFGCTSIIEQIIRWGYQGALRVDHAGKATLTDNGNYIYDITHPQQYVHPQKDLDRISQIHGVIEVGFVIAKVEVWVGYTDGRIEKRSH